MALEVAHVLEKKFNIKTEIAITNQFDLRSYQTSALKSHEILDFTAQYSVTDTVTDLMSHISEISDFSNPIYHNARWCKEKGLLV
jgi:hypothetical protein